MERNIFIVLATVLFAYCSAKAVPNDNAGILEIQEIQKTNASKAALAYGCCPQIVPPGPTGSLITGYSGYRGEAAIIVDWGTCPAQPPGGFMWSVYWGDGTSNTNYATTLGPYQAVHQYTMAYPSSYYVTTSYCSNPPYPLLPCCASLSGFIFTFQKDG